MGIYLNPGNAAFSEAVHSQIYVDKTELISYTNSVLATNQKNICVSRPRRFGKSITANMLAAYYSKGCQSDTLFKDRKISCSKDYKKYLNTYTTIFLNIQEFLSRSSNVEELIQRIRRSLMREIRREYPTIDFYDELDLTENMKEIYAETNEPFIIIIDEWDCIFREYAEDKAAQERYLDFLRDFLKDKAHIHLAYMTGILPIKKYGTHSALNMFDEFSMANPGVLAQYVGFTENEVRCLCSDYQMDLAEIKEWYDGYNFGKINVYCPWDVMNYVRDLRIDPDMKPASYWKNTSDNAIIRSFIDYAGSGIQKKMEKLMAGDTIDQKIEENLTYDYLHSSEENFWSILYLTGYLTRDKEEKESADGKITLKIPNKEIREIFETTVQDWFSDTAKLQDRKHLFDAVWNKDADKVTKEISTLLRMTISYYDYREDFYHAFLAGIFAGAGYSVESNREHGEGRSDIVIYNDVTGQVAVFEAKYARKLDDLEKDCQKALDQINTKMYAKEFEDAYEEVLCYGIAFYKKRCLVKSK